MPLPLPTDSVWQLDTPLLAAPANPNNTSMWGFGSNTVFPGNDPDFEDVGYLLYWNDPVNTIIPTDRVPGNTWTATLNSSVARNSVQSTRTIFGGDNSLRVNTAVDSHTFCQKAADFYDTPTGILTLEGWFRYDNPAADIDPFTVGFISRNGSGSNSVSIQASSDTSPSQVRVIGSFGGGDFGGTSVLLNPIIAPGTRVYPPFANNWNHLAISYDGVTVRLFLNGIIVASQASAPRRLRIDRYAVGQTSSPVSAIQKYLSNCRFTRDVARYTANFTPPTGPFPDYGPNGP